MSSGGRNSRFFRRDADKVRERCIRKGALKINAAEDGVRKHFICAKPRGCGKRWRSTVTYQQCPFCHRYFNIQEVK